MKYKKVVVLLAVATLGIAGCGKGNNDTVRKSWMLPGMKSPL